MRSRKKRKCTLAAIPVQHISQSQRARRLLVCLVRLNGGAMAVREQRTSVSNAPTSIAVSIATGVRVRSGSAWTLKSNECFGLWKKGWLCLSAFAVLREKFLLRRKDAKKECYAARRNMDSAMAGVARFCVRGGVSFLRATDADCACCRSFRFSLGIGDSGLGRRSHPKKCTTRHLRPVRLHSKSTLLW